MVCGVADTRLTERLLRSTDMDLEKAISICRAAESSQQQLRVIEGDIDRGVEAVAARPKQAQQSARQPPSGNHGDPYVLSLWPFSQSRTLPSNREDMPQF